MEKEEDNKKERIECTKKIELIFNRESQRDKHHYELSSISFHNATNSHIL